MSISKRVKGGRSYLMIDNRASGGKLLEFATATCAHCGFVVILNPNRKRERERCRKCNAYVCDAFVCRTECHPIMQSLDLLLKYPNSGEPFLARGKNGEVLHDVGLEEKNKIYHG